MALVSSNMLSLGTVAPDFLLTDAISGKIFSYNDLSSKQATLVMFICNHCPYVIHVREQLVLLANEYIAKGVSFIAINSNDVENYPDDSPENMKKIAEQFGYPFAYLFDQNQSVGRAYDAACTPDFYLFDSNNKLAYRGRLDASTPGSALPVTGEDLRFALDDLLAGNTVNPVQTPSMGCSIKWRD